MSFYDKYFDMPGISNSQLSDINQSIAYWKFKKENEQKPTVATLLGSGLHECILEPKKFATRNESSQKTVSKTYLEKDYTKGSEKLLFGQLEEIELMKNALLNHPQGKDIFTDAEKEVPVYFEYNGIECKAKIDWVNPKRKLIMDLKSIAKISDADKNIFFYDYYRQAVFYQLACEKMYGDIFDFRFVFVSKDELPEVKVVELSGEWFAMGLDEVDRLIKKYKDYLSGFELFEGAYKEVVTLYPTDWQYKLIMGAEAV